MTRPHKTVLLRLRLPQPQEVSDSTNTSALIEHPVFFVSTVLRDPCRRSSCSRSSWPRASCATTDTSILHHAFISIFIALWAVITHYVTILMPILFYKVYIKRENAGSWNSGLEKEQILETYSAQLQ